MSQVEITIPRSATNDDHAEYELVVSTGGERHKSVWKRYSEFQKLNDDIIQRFPDPNVQKVCASFPGRTFILSGTDPGIVDKRRVQLQAYLQGLCNTDVFADMGFHKFVGLAPNVDLDAYDDTTGYEEVQLDHVQLVDLDDKGNSVPNSAVRQTSVSCASPSLPNGSPNEFPQGFGGRNKVSANKVSVSSIPQTCPETGSPVTSEVQPKSTNEDSPRRRPRLPPVLVDRRSGPRPHMGAHTATQRSGAVPLDAAPAFQISGLGEGLTVYEGQYNLLSSAWEGRPLYGQQSASKAHLYHDGYASWCIGPSADRHDEHIAHLESHASSLDDVVSKDQTGWLVWHADTRSWVKRPQVRVQLVCGQESINSMKQASTVTSSVASPSSGENKQQVELMSAWMWITLGIAAAGAVALVVRFARSASRAKVLR